jgi:hypothetical protein
MGLQFDVLNASTSGEINAAFVTLMRERPDGLFVAGDPFFSIRRIQLVNLAAPFEPSGVLPRRIRGTVVRGGALCSQLTKSRSALSLA